MATLAEPCAGCAALETEMTALRQMVEALSAAIAHAAAYAVPPRLAAAARPRWLSAVPSLTGQERAAG